MFTFRVDNLKCPSLTEFRISSGNVHFGATFVEGLTDAVKVTDSTALSVFKGRICCTETNTLLSN